MGNEVAKEVVWLKKFISDLGVIHKRSDPVEIFYDSEGAVMLLHVNPISNRSINYLIF